MGRHLLLLQRPLCGHALYAADGQLPGYHPYTNPNPDPNPNPDQVAFFKVFRNKVGEWTVTQRAANPAAPASRLQALKDPLLPAMLPPSVAP